MPIMPSMPGSGTAVPPELEPPEEPPEVEVVPPEVEVVPPEVVVEPPEEDEDDEEEELLLLDELLESQSLLPCEWPQPQECLWP